MLLKYCNFQTTLVPLSHSEFIVCCSYKIYICIYVCMLLIYDKVQIPPWTVQIVLHVQVVWNPEEQNIYFCLLFKAVLTAGKCSCTKMRPASFTSVNMITFRQPFVQKKSCLFMLLDHLKENKALLIFQQVSFNSHVCIGSKSFFSNSNLTPQSIRHADVLWILSQAKRICNTF